MRPYLAHQERQTNQQDEYDEYGNGAGVSRAERHERLCWLVRIQWVAISHAGRRMADNGRDYIIRRLMIGFRRNGSESVVS